MPRATSSASSFRPNREGKRVFAAGDGAFYWSTTHRTWLKCNVLSLNTDQDGKTLTYNLDCKSRVESWQMRHLEEPLDAPPDVSESPGGSFAVGMPVQCFNQVKKTWEDGIVCRRYQQNKIIVFDVDCGGSILRMLPASRLRLSRFAVGDQVEYWSTTSKAWLPAKVLRLCWARQSCDLDIKRGAPLANVRKVNEPVEMHKRTLEGHSAKAKNGRQPNGYPAPKSRAATRPTEREEETPFPASLAPPEGKKRKPEEAPLRRRKQMLEPREERPRKRRRDLDSDGGEYDNQAADVPKIPRRVN